MTLLEACLSFACAALFLWSFAITHMLVDLQNAVAEMLNEEEPSRDE